MDEIKEMSAADVAVVAATEPPSSHQAEEEIKEAVWEVEENPEELPGYQSTPLFAPHELRNEYVKILKEDFVCLIDIPHP